jgi:uncharacterized Zn-binding protein involved in type VI secretion
MGLPSARVGDMMIQEVPHCHAVHPVSPVPHPPIPLPIVMGCPTVLIGGMPAARVGDISEICVTVPCVPSGPGVIAMGSTTVLIGGMPAARLTDNTLHDACPAPIPGIPGMIMGPGCPTVLIG